ncbi:MAG TPA: hypothetical protein VHO70_08945 [Chitinispirillaceae bacterium]|nr:hypothetical protein [Chitinispirillaceae bacterium]
MHEETKAVIEKYSMIKNVESILLIGSRATSFYDEQSDYDFYIIYSGTKPQVAERSALTEIDGISNFEIKPESNLWSDEWIQSGETFSFISINVDSGYQSLDFLKSVVKGVVTDYEISLEIMKFRPYTIPGLLEGSQILYDKNGELTRLRQIVRPFPENLKKKLIGQYNGIVSGSLEDIENYCNRGIGNNAFLFHLWRVSDGICQILYALNEIYDPSTKRTEEHFELLKKKPVDFRIRFEKILEGPFSKENRHDIVNQLKLLYWDILSIK